MRFPPKGTLNAPARAGAQNAVSTRAEIAHCTPKNAHVNMRNARHGVAARATPWQQCPARNVHAHARVTLPQHARHSISPLQLVLLPHARTTACRPFTRHAVARRRRAHPLQRRAALRGAARAAARKPLQRKIEWHASSRAAARQERAAPGAYSKSSSAVYRARHTRAKRRCAAYAAFIIIKTETRCRCNWMRRRQQAYETQRALPHIWSDILAHIKTTLYMRARRATARACSVARRSAARTNATRWLAAWRTSKMRRRACARAPRARASRAKRCAGMSACAYEARRCAPAFASRQARGTPRRSWKAASRHVHAMPRRAKARRRWRATRGAAATRPRAARRHAHARGVTGCYG